MGESLAKSITKQKQTKILQKLSFCYLYGQPFKKACEVNREHVVARNLFRATDRENFPFILPSHKSCNNKQSNDDEIIRQLLRLLHPEKAKTH